MGVNSTKAVMLHLIEKARRKQRRGEPFADKLSPIQQELRLRRQQFLGTYVPVRELVLSSSGIDEDAVEVLSRYMSIRASLFWNLKDAEAENFCYRFYRLSIYALAGGRVARECVDDILQLADCLIRSRKVFMIAMKDMLSEDLIGELFDFIDTACEHYFTPAFFDAIMAGICVFLGVLCDPIDDKASEVEGD